MGPDRGPPPWPVVPLGEQAAPSRGACLLALPVLLAAGWLAVCLSSSHLWVAGTLSLSLSEQDTGVLTASELRHSDGTWEMLLLA